MTETQVENGTVPVTKLTDDEKAWLAALLSHQNVCALLSTPTDKAVASSIQGKLESPQSS